MVYSYCICPPFLAQAVEAAAGVVVVLIVTLDATSAEDLQPTYGKTHVSVKVFVTTLVAM